MTRTTAAASSHARRNRSRCPFSASSRVRIAVLTRACVIIILPLEPVSSDNFVLLTRPLLVDRWLAQMDVAARARQHQLALHVNGHLQGVPIAAREELHASVRLALVGLKAQRHLAIGVGQPWLHCLLEGFRGWSVESNRFRGERLIA